jgi:hypothetical protein
MRNMIRKRWGQIGYWTPVLADLLRGKRGKCLYVLGHPRSGTNWLCLLLEECTGMPVNRFWLRKLPTLAPRIIHLHRLLPFKSIRPRTVYILRDGRDVVVSWYLASFHDAHRERIPSIEAYIGRKMRREDLRENLPRFIEYLTQDRNSSVDYRRHVSTALERGLFMVKYEDLLQNTVETLARVVHRLTGEEPDLARIEQAVQHHDFKRRSGRKRGEEDSKSHFRKGVAGDWRNHFTREAAEVFDRYAGDLLVRVGYAEDRRWVETVGG